MTLLDIVQQILSDMDGDEVNSISDTEESEQIARHVVRSFDNLVSGKDWFHTKQLISLSPFADTDFPTHFELPPSVVQLEFINYDKSKAGDSRKNYQPVVWKEQDDFLRLLNMRDSSDPDTQQVVDSSGTVLLVKTDKSPTYFTSFNENDIVMDSFDSAVDTTLQQSKIQAYGYVKPTLVMQDSSTIDLPEDAISLLIETATTRAQFKTRQFQDVVSAQEASRQSRRMSRNQWRVNGGIKYPNYGRKV